MKLTTIITAIILFTGITALFAIDAAINKEAPNFTLKDSHGKEHTLSAYRGKIVVLEWINYGCPFVRKHYDSGNMQSLQKKYTGKDVVWLSICSSAPGNQGHFEPNEINKRNKEYKAMMSAYLIDEDGKVGKIYGAKTTPHMYIINTGGILVYAGGIDDTPSTKKEDIPHSKNYVAAALDELLSGKKCSQQVTKPYGCSVKYKD